MMSRFRATATHTCTKGPELASWTDGIAVAFFTFDRKPGPAYIHHSIQSLCQAEPRHAEIPIHIIIDGKSDAFVKQYRSHPNITLHPIEVEKWETQTAHWEIHRRIAFSYHRCFSLALESKASGILICEDDVLFRHQFLSRLNTVLTEMHQDGWQDFVLSLYDPHPEPRERRTSLARGKYYGAYPGWEFYGGQAVYFPQSVLKLAIEFWAQRGWKDRVAAERPNDLLIGAFGEWLWQRNPKHGGIYAAYRSLVQHAGKESHTGLSPNFHCAPSFSLPWHDEPGPSRQPAPENIPKTVSAKVMTHNSEIIYQAACSRSFRFGRKTGAVLAENIILHSSGRIYGNCHANESFWEVWQDYLLFLDHRHQPTTMFNYIPEGPRQFYGRFLLKSDAAEPDLHHWLERNEDLLSSKDRFEIVVAKYNEDVSWTAPWRDNVTIYNKNPNDPRFPTLPNVGREAGTYLYHMLTRFDTLAERTLFLQGHPFDHPLLKIAEYGRAEGDFVCNTDRHHPFHCDHRWDIGFISARAKRAFWDTYIRKPLPPRHSYVSGAQFAVSRDLVRRRGREYITELYTLSQQPSVALAGETYNNYHIGVLFEIFWPCFF